MRRLGPLLAALALLVPLPAGHAQGSALTVDVEPGSAAQAFQVDLMAGTTTSIVFRLDEADYPTLDIDAVVLRLSKGGDEIAVQMQSPAAQGTGGTVWSGTLAVADRDLTKGIHAIDVKAVTPSGLQAVDSRVRTLEVLAAETAAPTLRVSGESADGKLRLGPGEDVTVLVDDAGPSSGLRRVTYRTPQLSAAAVLDFPYVITGAAFTEGTQDLTLGAVDRAGNVAAKVVKVIVDTKAPTLEVQAPEHLFVGIPAVLLAGASDANAYNVTVQYGNDTRSLPGTGVATTHTFPVTAQREGPVDFTVRATDLAGNSAEKRITVNATVLQTDTTIKGMTLAPERPVVGEPVVLHVSVAQDPGFATLDVNVTLSGAVASTHRVAVQPALPADLAVSLRPTAGRHVVDAHVEAARAVNETDASDQDGSLAFEVYLAKVTDGGQTYFIRANDAGLPLMAIGPGNATHPLTVVQEGSVVAYQFEADGKTLSWKPFTGSATDTGTDDGEAKGSPGLLPPLMALALLAAVALRRRR